MNQRRGKRKYEELDSNQSTLNNYFTKQSQTTKRQKCNHNTLNNSQQTQFQSNHNNQINQNDYNQENQSQQIHPNDNNNLMVNSQIHQSDEDNDDDLKLSDIETTSGGPTKPPLISNGFNLDQNINNNMDIDNHQNKNFNYSFNTFKCKLCNNSIKFKKKMENFMILESIHI